MSSNRIDASFIYKVHWEILKGEDSYHSSCNWCQLNIQLTMGTLASGIGSTNMYQLISFLDIKTTKALSKRFMGNMESSIGVDMRKVATDSMLVD